MRMRLTSDFWTASLMRQVRVQGGFAYLARRGALEAGAIFIEIRRKDNLLDLYGPAPQSVYKDDNLNNERLFVCLLSHETEEAVTARLEKELRFDEDIWLVEIEGLTMNDLLFKVISL